MRRPRVRLFAIVLVVASLALACGEEEEPGGGVEESMTIQAFDFYFDPTAISVGVGSEVTIELTNNGDVAHSFTATDLDVEVEASGAETASVTFTAPDEPGSYDFFCKFHPDEMQGTISIGGSDEPMEEQPEGEDEDEDVEVEVDTEEDDSDTSSDDDY